MRKLLKYWYANRKKILITIRSYSLHSYMFKSGKRNGKTKK